MARSVCQDGAQEAVSFFVFVSLFVWGQDLPTARNGARRATRSVSRRALDIRVGLLDRTLIEGQLLMDATIEEIGGRWSMFACEAREERLPWTDLLLFHADSPLGPWTAHPMSPVVSNVRHARPSGRLFRRSGALLRPAQDCSRTYGGAISLRRIVTLTTTVYEEVEEAYVAGGA